MARRESLNNLTVYIYNDFLVNFLKLQYNATDQRSCHSILITEIIGHEKYKCGVLLTEHGVIRKIIRYPLTKHSKTDNFYLASVFSPFVGQHDSSLLRQHDSVTVEYFVNLTPSSHCAPDIVW